MLDLKKKTNFLVKGLAMIIRKKRDNSKEHENKDKSCYKPTNLDILKELTEELLNSSVIPSETHQPEMRLQK